MPSDLVLTVAVLLATVALFLQGRLPSDVVAVLSLMALVLLGVITPAEALAGFSSSLVLMIAGLFVVGAGIFRTGLADAAGRWVAERAGTQRERVLLALMGVVSLLSGFISNTGTVAVLMPVVVSLAGRIGVSASQFLMPLALITSLGALTTIIGTPPNLVAAEALKNAGASELGFFALLPLAVIALVIGGLYFLILGPRLLPDRVPAGKSEGKKGTEELLGLYELPTRTVALRVGSGAAAGKNLRELNWTSRFAVRALMIERETRGPRELPQQSSVLQAGDTVYVLGENEDIERLSAEDGLLTLPETDFSDATLTDRRLGIAEILIPEGSRFTGRTLSEVNWPAAWGVGVLGLRRGGVRQEITSELRLRFADSILIQGQWEKIEAMARESRHVVVLGAVGDHAADAGARGKAPIAGGLLVLMMLLMTFNLVPPVVAVWVAAMAMVLSGCLRNMDEAYRRIGWSSVVLIAAMLPMATALEKTGGTALLANFFVENLGQHGPTAVLAGIALAVMIVGQFISNTATAVLFVPIALSAATGLGVRPEPLVIAAAVASSMSFSTPISTPPNAMVMTAGGYTFADYLRVGLPLQALLLVAMVLAIPRFFPF